MCLVMLTLPFQGAAAAVMAMSMAGDEAGMAMQQDMPGMQMSGCHDEMPGMSASASILRADETELLIVSTIYGNGRKPLWFSPVFYLA